MAQLGLRVAFTDFWPGFRPDNHIVLHALAAHHDLTVADPSTADLLVFSIFGGEHQSFRSTKVHYSEENTPLASEHADFSIGCHQLVQPRYIRIPPFIVQSFEDQLTGFAPNSAVEWADRDFCNFIYSHAGPPVRQALYERLNAYRRVTSPGQFLSNTSSQPLADRFDEHWRRSKIRYQQRFRFTIACENSSAPGYVSEKLYDALVAGTVPIYWGHPSVTDDIDAGAFINCNSFRDLDELVRCVQQVDEDTELARRYLAAAGEALNVPVGEYFERLVAFFDDVVGFAERHADRGRPRRVSGGRRAPRLRRASATRGGTPPLPAPTHDLPKEADDGVHREAERGRSDAIVLGPMQEPVGEVMRPPKELADLGLPLPRTRLRTLKRVVVRLSWVFLHRQIGYNHAIVKALESLTVQLHRATAAAADSEERQQRELVELRRRADEAEEVGVRRHHDDLAEVWGELGALRDAVVRSARQPGRWSPTAEQHPAVAAPSAGSPVEAPVAGARAGRSLAERRAPLLSVCCLTSDTGPAVGALLGQLRQVADEIFVAVDSRTETGSVSDLEDVADRVIRYQFAPPFERALGWAHAQCSGDWILRIDSDEVAAPSLIEALPDLIRARDVVMYQIPKRWLFPDVAHWIDEYPWSMDYQARLVRNDPASLWFEGIVHSTLVQAGPTHYLDTPIYHLLCTQESLDARRARVARYSAEDTRPEGPRAINRAHYLPELYATNQPRPVPPEHLAAITDVIQAGENEAHRAPPRDHTVPVVGRREIDRHWDRRTLAPDTHRASLTLLECDTRMHTNQHRLLHVRVTNLGPETWPGGDQRHPLIVASYHWLRADGSVVEEGPRSALPGPLAPGASSIVPVAVVAPPEPARYVLEIDLVHEHVRWFGSPVRQEITVTTDLPRWLAGSS